nr:peptidase C15 [Jeotgalicoccus pinnipedialis]
MKTLLLTGYEPFLKFETNPTESAVKSLNGTSIGEYKIVSRVYPVSFKSIACLIKKDIDEVKPDAIVHLGLAGNIHSVHLERIAINCIDGRPDNEGFHPNGEKISEDGPDAIFSSLPLKRLEKVLLENNIPVTISNSAGTYLCNNLMYCSLYYLKEKNLNIPSGFVHVPANMEISIANKIPGWPQNYINVAVTKIIENL